MHLNSRNSMRIRIGGLILAATVTSMMAQPLRTVEPGKEYAATLLKLSGKLVSLQLTDTTAPSAGAFQCPHCGILHTRAAESVYPLAMAHKIGGDERFFRAAVMAGNWLIRQQEQDGSWKETPEEWTGTTTDQLLMMVEAYDLLSVRLTDRERAAWGAAIQKAASYLARVMSVEFASINYCATTTASLARTNVTFPDPRLLQKARDLARRIVAKMDSDGFIVGEGGRAHNDKYGVDLGYNMEMSLWGLGYYARLTGDTIVDGAVKRSLRRHLTFIYPDGSMDGSWGIRSNKWTVYGGATSDGCQALFSLYADEDPRYVTASLKNLEFVRTCLVDGLVGYGPHHTMVLAKPPCIYPTFAKAKNLALAYKFEARLQRSAAPLPTEATGWGILFPTLQVAQVRTKGFMTTLTAYGYKDMEKREKSKYMFRPAGGSICNLWVEGYGMLQASSQTVYSRPEPMHFPEVDTIRSLTPRIEVRSREGYFSNLFDFDARMTLRSSSKDEFLVETVGELKDQQWMEGGIGFEWLHKIGNSRLEKRLNLRYHDALESVTIVEPIIWSQGMTVVQVEPRRVRITAKGTMFDLVVLEGDVTISTDDHASEYWSPYPALKAIPITLTVSRPSEFGTKTIRYELVRIPAGRK